MNPQTSEASGPDESEGRGSDSGNAGSGSDPVGRYTFRTPPVLRGDIAERIAEHVALAKWERRPLEYDLPGTYILDVGTDPYADRAPYWTPSDLDALAKSNDPFSRAYARGVAQLRALGFPLPHA